STCSRRPAPPARARKKRKPSVHILRGHEGAVRCIAYAPDGTRLASGGEDGTLRLWNLATGAEETSSERAGASIEALAFSPKDTRLAIGTSGGRVVLWVVNRSQPRERGIGCTGGVRGLAFHPKIARNLAVGGWSEHLRVWALIGKRATRVFEQSTPPVLA